MGQLFNYTIIILYLSDHHSIYCFMNCKAIYASLSLLIMLCAQNSVAQTKNYAALASRPMAMYSKDGIDYVDAEHAYYKAPLRTSRVYACYKKMEAGKDDYYIVIEKSKYIMSVYNSNDELMITYPVVFGNDDLEDKMCEGDKRTPEGTFYILNKKPHNQWDKYFSLSYPSEESIQKYNERKAKGLIKGDPGVGGGIGLHGTWKRDEIAVDRKANWTSGCVSTKNCYIEEMYSYIPVGTKVIIRR